MAPSETTTLPELDYLRLDRDLDRTKTRVFLGKNAAFLGPLMCSLEFKWDTTIETAATNGLMIKWNPYYFHFLSRKVVTPSWCMSSGTSL